MTTEAVSILQQRFRSWANSIAARYGHPVYLVGSALNAVELADVYKLRDVDIVCILPDDEFTNRFAHWTWCCNGDDEPGANRWAAEVGKLSARASQDMRNVNVDFKVQSEEWADRGEHKDKPRVRLDTADFDEVGEHTGPKAKAPFVPCRCGEFYEASRLAMCPACAQLARLDVVDRGIVGLERDCQRIETLIADTTALVKRGLGEP